MDTHYHLKTALSIVRLNNIQCCAVCAYYEEYEHDLGSEWYCDARDDIGIDSEPAINVYKMNECDIFELSGDYDGNVKS